MYVAVADCLEKGIVCMVTEKTTAVDTIAFLKKVMIEVKEGTENIKFIADSHQAHWTVDVLRYVEEIGLKITHPPSWTPEVSEVDFYILFYKTLTLFVFAQANNSVETVFAIVGAKIRKKLANMTLDEMTAWTGDDLKRFVVDTIENFSETTLTGLQRCHLPWLAR